MGYRGVPTIRKRIIGNQLRKMRREHEMSLEDMASSLGISRSAADRRESGHAVTRVDDLQRYFELFGITDSEYRSRLEALSRLCERRGWWSRYNSSVGTAHVNFADAEDLASEIYYVRAVGIPSLLETEAYAKSELEGARRLLELRGISVEKSLELRERRKKVLDRTDPPRISAVLAEPCILTREGELDVMRGQIEHLIELAQCPNVTIQILPMDRGYPSSMEAITVMKFADEIDGGVVIDVSGPFDDESGITDLHLAQFDEDQARSLTADESLDYLGEVLSSLDE